MLRQYHCINKVFITFMQMVGFVLFFFFPEEDILMFTIMNMELLTVDFETSGGILSMQFILLQNLS